MKPQTRRLWTTDDFICFVVFSGVAAFCADHLINRHPDDAAEWFMVGVMGTLSAILACAFLYEIIKGRAQ